ncbi:S8 family serine peptidase [Cellulomonas aerilata]|uniref:Serine protease n=1 Tax=Cellulomonas aerilata TaxID=515326 RepID=A0A512DD66_9CELL|nr:S8 family serine peptidase [Cellulomonas aerilata]GEO34412.1 serine protease [Cellulomonas aerilata]
MIATAPTAGAAVEDPPVAVTPPPDGGQPPGEVGTDGKADANDKLGDHDRELLAEAQAGGEEAVTVLLATEAGQAPAVAEQVAGLGGDVGFTDDELGYVRAQLPTGAVEKAASSDSVLRVDLNEGLALPDPTADERREARRPGSAPVPGPSAQTPVRNPYMPTAEIGAASFVRSHPEWDGRGVTIGILDSGVDLDHPSLQTTSTGERKIVDWVTATDPLVDGDPTWRAMRAVVAGPTFAYQGSTWTAPAGDFRINRFSEAITAGSEVGGDVNRDGDTTDVWGVLYRASDNAIWVDTDQDLDFTDEELRRPYGEAFQVGHLGTDDPATAVQESMPFVVEFREDVDLTPAGFAGQTADFVNIGIVEAAHGSHVAGIAAGNALFGGDVSGAAPGATLVSSRACTWSGSCTAVALVEGMIDLVRNRGVDVVNMSIGGLPALNDGNNARALLYNRLIAETGVQIFLSAGNSGPGLNTVGDPGVATDAVAVGAAVSRDTYLANYGAAVSADQALFTFSSRGPREDGGLKPNITAPGSAISTVPLWQEGGPVPEAGYDLPPGYAMFNGTSMASPMAAGGAALLLSAARAEEIAVTPAQLRKAIYSSADFERGLPSYEQGLGQLDVPDAWSLLRRADRLEPVGYEVTAPVCTPLSGLLATPHVGTGVYDRCPASAGGAVPGTQKTYEVTVTRTSGDAGDRVHTVSLLSDDGTFRAPRTVRLPLDVPVTIPVRANPASGAHGAVLQLDDPRVLGVEQSVSLVVVASDELAAPSFGWETSGSVERARTQSHFVTVPEGAAALRVNLTGIAAGSQTRFIAINPNGIAVDPTASSQCFTNFSDVTACDPSARTYADPAPGVWEIEVEARRTTPTLANPYVVGAGVLGVEVEPAVTEIESAGLGEVLPLAWTVTNTFGETTVAGQGGPLGSGARSRQTVADGATQEYAVDVPEGAERLDVSIGSPSDARADLDLVVLLDGVQVAIDADGDSEESVSITDPAPGTYTVLVDGFEVPAGTTEFDYLDVFYAGSLGELAVTSAPVTLAPGATTEITGTVTVGAVPAAGRSLFGTMSVVTGDGAVVGTGSVLVREVRP